MDRLTPKGGAYTLHSVLAPHAMKWLGDPARITSACDQMVRTLLGAEPPAI
jgi:hypothetical protein